MQRLWSVDAQRASRCPRTMPTRSSPQRSSRSTLFSGCLMRPTGARGERSVILGLTRRKPRGRYLEPQMSVREKQPDVALEPPEQFGEIAKGVSPCRVVRKTEGRPRRATRECAGLIMKRAERIVPLKAAALLRCGAARALAHGHRSASPACSGVRCRRASPERLRGCGPAWSARRSRASG